MLYLIDVKYDGGAKVVRLFFYNTIDNTIYSCLDDSGHKPYCLTNLDPINLDKISKIRNHPEFDHYEIITKFDPLLNKEVNLTKIIAKVPTAIGGKGKEAIRDILKETPDAKVWEANIHYEACAIYDNNWRMGMPYRFEGDKLIPCVIYEAEDATDSLSQLFSSRIEKIKKWARLLEYPAPNFRRVALDIEVLTSEEVRVPDPTRAEFPIVSCCLLGSDGKRQILLLLRENTIVGDEILPEGTTLQFFDKEVDLIKSIFVSLLDYPMTITFNGDQFDLHYIRNRALKLNIPKEEIPIELGYKIATIKNRIHIDLYKLFFNRSLRIYTFQEKYKNISLDEIGEALLGRGKIGKNTWLATEMPKWTYTQLAAYNCGDGDITLDLTKFDNELIMKLIVLLMRISNMGIEDVNRASISRWLLSLLRFESRRRNYLIPNKEDIINTKGGVATKAIIKGKKYRGATVVKPPASGVIFNVKVMDFASLYPSIMKVYNIGFQTMNCSHKECISNIVPETPHHICTKYNSMEGEILGDLRDLRVKWYKPKKKNPWYSAVEQSVKVILNAAYGIFGNEEFSLYCPPVSECYSDDTEILTENGWKLFKDLDKTEKVATLNSKTNELEYQKPTKYIEQNYNGKMFYQRGRINLLVTPNHKLFIATAGRNNYKKIWKWKFLNAGDAIRYMKFRRNSIWRGKEEEYFIVPSIKNYPAIKISMDDWLRFFGIWLAEGCTVNNKNNQYQVIVTQQNIQKRKIIIKWLKKLPFYFSSNNRNLRCHNKQLWTYLRQFGKAGDKYIPIELLELSSRQLRILFDAMMLGDGTKRRDSYGTKSKKLADDFQELLLKIGYVGTIGKRMTEGGEFSSKRCLFYDIDISYKMFTPLMNKGKNNSGFELYSGKVYCVEVPNHIVYVRRNGKPVWCGNSVTAIGRNSIGRTIKKAEELKINVLYGDTDSIFLENPSEDQIKSLINWANEELGLDLEAEKTYRYVIFSGRKKNYLGVRPDGTLDIKGLTGKKKHIPPIIKGAFEVTKKYLSNAKTPEDIMGVKNGLKEVVKILYSKLKRREWDNLEELSFRITLGADPDDYQKTTPQHIKAARVLQDKGYFLKKGDSIMFVKTKTPEGVLPTKYATDADIDVDKYLEMLQSTFAQILDAFEIPFTDIIGITQLTKFL